MVATKIARNQEQLQKLGLAKGIGEFTRDETEITMPLWTIKAFEGHREASKKKGFWELWTRWECTKAAGVIYRWEALELKRKEVPDLVATYIAIYPEVGTLPKPAAGRSTRSKAASATKTDTTVENVPASNTTKKGTTNETATTTNQSKGSHQQAPDTTSQSKESHQPAPDTTNEITQTLAGTSESSMPLSGGDHSQTGSEVMGHEGTSKPPAYSNEDGTGEAERGCRFDHSKQETFKEESNAAYAKSPYYLSGKKCAECNALLTHETNKTGEAGEVFIKPTGKKPVWACRCVPERNCDHVLCNACFSNVFLTEDSNRKPKRP